jgi:hypothetical protein
MDLSWNKCQGDVWCRLATVNLAHEHFNNMYGVYVIWHGGTQPATVKVGRGVIRNELQQERADAQVQAFANLGLFVTWASVPEQQAPGVQAFLLQKLKPKIAFATAGLPAPIVATLPW